MARFSIARGKTTETDVYLPVINVREILGEVKGSNCLAIHSHKFRPDRKRTAMTLRWAAATGRRDDFERSVVRSGADCTEAKE